MKEMMWPVQVLTNRTDVRVLQEYLRNTTLAIPMPKNLKNIGKLPEYSILDDPVDKNEPGVLHLELQDLSSILQTMPSCMHQEG